MWWIDGEGVGVESGRMRSGWSGIGRRLSGAGRGRSRFGAGIGRRRLFVLAPFPRHSLVSSLDVSIRPPSSSPMR